MPLIPSQEIKQVLKEKDKYWIVFTGDSITSCEWVHPNWRDIVVYVLQSEMTDDWRIRGFNFAYNGATTKDVLGHIDDILILKPNLVIGLMGGNDPVLGISPLQHIENIQKIADRVNAESAKLVWCTSTPAGKGSKKNQEYEPYAKAFLSVDIRGISKVDIYSRYQQTPTQKFFTFISEENPVEGIKEGEPDLQHPNQLGNAYIAKLILKEIFGVEFNPDKYIQETLEGKKYPDY